MLHCFGGALLKKKNRGGKFVQRVQTETIILIGELLMEFAEVGEQALVARNQNSIDEYIGK